MGQVEFTSWHLPLSKSVISAFESSVSSWHQSSARTVSLSLLQTPVVVHCGRRNYKVPSVENPEMTDVLSFKPGAGQNIAKHALPTAKNLFLVLISDFQVHSPSFIFYSESSAYFLTTSDLASTISRVVRRLK